jgi:hypothetical protein
VASGEEPEDREADREAGRGSSLRGPADVRHSTGGQHEADDGLSDPGVIWQVQRRHDRERRGLEQHQDRRRSLGARSTELSARVGHRLGASGRI